MDVIDIPHLNAEVKEENIEMGAFEILKEIRPTWDKSSIKFMLLTDGITNKLVGCKPEGADDEDTVLIRIYGNKTDMMIDRKAETRNIILLNRAGIAPNLYATFKNGLAYRFLPGCTLTCKSVRDPTIYKLVAKQMAILHKVDPNDGSTKPFIWDKLGKFLDLVPDQFTDPNKQRRYLKEVTHKTKLEKEVQQLKEVLEKIDNPLVFAHNDLLLGNVIYNEQQKKVTFIDYEYAALNYQAFDVANHFAEFTGTRDIDYSLYPDKKFQLNWMHTYLAEFTGRNPSSEELEDMYVQVNKFALLAHVFWGIWGLVQAEHSAIDFDYLGYAAIRFEEYFKKKELFLSLKMSS